MRKKSTETNEEERKRRKLQTETKRGKEGENERWAETQARIVEEQTLTNLKQVEKEKGERNTARNRKKQRQLENMFQN